MGMPAHTPVSGGFHQTLMLKRFFKNAGIMAVTEIILRLKGFIFIPLLTRHFGPISYGVWSQVGVLVSIFTPLLVLGTDSSITRYLPGRPIEEQKRLFTAWTLFLTALALPAAILLIFFRNSLKSAFFGTDPEYERFIPLAAAALMLNILLNLVRNWYRLQSDARLYSAISIAQTVAGVAAVVIMMVLKVGAYELVLYTLLGDLVIITIFLLIMTCGEVWRKPDFAIIPTLLKFGLPLVPTAYAMWGLNWMDRLFLVKYSTLEELGIYSLAYNLGYMIIQVLVNPVWVMYPNSSTELYNRNDMQGVQRLFEHTAGAILIFTVPAAAGLLALGRPILATLATPQFIEGAPLMAVVTAGYLFLMLAAFFETALGWIHRQYLCTVSVISACTVNLILNFILIPRCTIYGAAFATTLAFLFQLILSYLMARPHRLLTVNLKLPLKVTLASAVMGTAVYALTYLTPDHGAVPLLILPVAGIIIYSGLILLMKIVTLDFLKAAVKSLALH